jgi:CheY-like chemotaxis protein
VVNELVFSPRLRIIKLFQSLLSKVLVVDASITARRLTEHQLTKKGLHVDVASNGENALLLMKKMVCK